LKMCKIREIGFLIK